MPLDQLNCFVMVLRRLNGKVDICQTDYSTHSKQRTFPYSNVMHGSTTFKLKKGRAKEKNQLLNTPCKVDVFVLSFIFFIVMCETKSFINRTGTCYFLHATN